MFFLHSVSHELFTKRGTPFWKQGLALSASSIEGFNLSPPRVLRSRSTVAAYAHNLSILLTLQA